ncbi:hypothetical protein CSB37_01735 [bacterium DOLZORAL124_38_8]|nr:MAG: hypothetical protein CSB37_01735 [bacterium DOLZORAL124_38_8]
MKQILWILPLICISTTQAYWLGTDFEKTDQKVSIQVQNNTAKITQTFVIKNTKNTPNNTTWLEKQTSVSDAKMFVDLQGQPIQILTNKADQAQNIWKVAQKYQDETAFRFFNTKKNLLISRPINFAPSEEKTIKIEFSTHIPAVQNFTQLELHNHNKWPIKKSKIHTIFVKNPSIFYHFLSTPKSIYRNQQLHALWENSQIKAAKTPITFLWSYAPEATASWKTPFGTFLAYFKPYPNQVPHQKISVFLDTSGSMSDGKWTKVKTILPEILAQFPNSQFQIGTISQEFNWWNEAFLPNQKPLQKIIYDQTFHLAPLGKLDLKQIPETESDLKILITDEESVSLPQKNNWFVVHLGLQNPNQNKPKERHLNLFPYQTQFIKKDYFAKQWQLFRSPLNLKKDRPTVFPKGYQFFTLDRNPVFWERIESATNPRWEPSPFEWTMPFWTAQRINELIAQSQPKRHRDTNILDALLSIGKNFGVENFFFQANTTRQQLQRWLWKLPETQITTERIKLAQQKTFFQTPNLQKAHSQYASQTTDHIWKTSDWDTHAKAPFIDEMPPFSETQKTLFEFWPETFSEYFALGKNVAFCVKRKCFRVSPETKHETSPQTAKLFLKSNQQPHWADEFIYQVAKKNALKIPNNQKINPNKNMTRGDFANMVTKYAGWKLVDTRQWEKDDVQIFPDVPTQKNFANAVYTLKAKGIIQGFNDGLFHPERTISRAEALKILFSMRKIKPYQWDTKRTIFTDTDGWKKPWANLAYRKKVVTGVQENNQKKFLPNNTVTLGEAAKMLVKIFDL